MCGLLDLVIFTAFAGTKSNEVGREAMVVANDWRVYVNG